MFDKSWSVPESIEVHGILVGKIIIKKSAVAFSEIASSFDSVFVGALAVDHGALAGLSDDDHTQYLLASGARALAGPWDMGSQALTNVNIDSGVITGITALAVTDGGTGASTASVARTNLGVAIGSNVQAHDALLDSLAGLTVVSGDIIYATGADTFVVLNKGIDTDVLTLAAGVPSWATQGAPGAHAATHQNGGGDEISVAALSGLLADDQHVLDSEVTAVAISKTLMTTRGDIIYRNATVPARLAKGTEGHALIMGANDPEWAVIPGFIENAEIWRLVGSTTVNANPLVLTGTMEADDTSGAGSLGSAMTVASGIFTFPQTGIWEITFIGSEFHNGGGGTTRISIERAEDAGSGDTYVVVSTSLQTCVSNERKMAVTQYLFDVTSVTTHKIRFSAADEGGNDWSLQGSTSNNVTNFLFKRLGAT